MTPEQDAALSKASEELQRKLQKQADAATKQEAELRHVLEPQQ